METISPFYLKLESIAANMTPDDALEHLFIIAGRLELIVCANINDITVTVYPNGNVRRAKQMLTEALEKRDEKYLIFSGVE